MFAMINTLPSHGRMKMLGQNVEKRETIHKEHKAVASQKPRHSI